MPTKAKSSGITPPPDRKATPEEGLAFIKKMIQARLGRAQESMAYFKGELEKHPYYAMEWSDYAFEAAAVIHAYGEALRAIEAPDSKVTPASLREYACDRVMRGAQSPTRSTSPVKGVAVELVVAAWAEIYDITRGL